MKKIINFFKKNRSIAILVVIFSVGLFLRTWHFSDWMVFNPDQARDAMLVQDVLEGRESAVLMGPEVGNEHFGLGPWFYHLEILSAKVFGLAPWKLAIPDLLFSLLSIILFYIFSKRYFSENISLVLTFFVSISYFMVRYSRFAFNPNSIPFFVLLFLLGVLFFMENDRKRVFGGAAMVGIGIGVGMQLHILLLFVMPTVIGLAMAYAFFRKKPWKHILSSVGIIIFFVLFVNAGQIAYEVGHNWSNSKRFIKTTTRTAEGGGNGGNLSRDLLCQAQANLHIISSLGDSEECKFYSTYNKFLKNGMASTLKVKKNMPLVVVGSIFTLGGYLLLFYFWRREKDEKKKNFLALSGIYGIISLVAMYPIITQASLRYYIVISFLPFIFFGIWLEFISQILRGKTGKVAMVSVVLIVAFFQFGVLKKTAATFQNKSASDSNYAIYGEVKDMMGFIAANSKPGEDVYIAGKSSYFSRFYKPFLYFGPEYNLNIQRGEKDKFIKPGAHVFYLRNDTSDKKINGKTFLGRSAQSWKTYKNVSIIDFGK